MKRIVAYVLTSLLTFTCAMTLSALLARQPHSTEKLVTDFALPVFPAIPPPSETDATLPDAEIVFVLGG